MIFVIVFGNFSESQKNGYVMGNNVEFVLFVMCHGFKCNEVY